VSLPAGVKAGDRVTAKRAGWDEQLTPEQYMDLEPLDEKGYASADLVGELAVMDVPASEGVPAFQICLVGGQEADPKTIRPAP
jgi:hypothetical protein